MENEDLALIDTDDLVAEIFRRCDVGVVCYTRENMPQGGKTLMCWHREGGFRECIGLMTEVSSALVHGANEGSSDHE